MLILQSAVRLSRTGHLLNIKGEKISERIFADALSQAAALGFNIQTVVNFGVCKNVTLPAETQITGTWVSHSAPITEAFICTILGELPYYVMFVELMTS